MSRQGQALRSAPAAPPQWKAPLSLHSLRRVSKTCQETPPQKAVPQTSLQAPGRDPLLLVDLRGGGGGWFWVPGLGPRPGSRGGCRNQWVRPPRSRNTSATCTH